MTARSVSWFKQYKSRACRTCPARPKCTRSEKERLIQRSEYADYYERNLANTRQNEYLYKRRQTIVEHPYGTIKRQWGFSYILTKKGMSRAGSDVGLMFIAYNLRRIGNILTAKVLKEYLRMLLSLLSMENHHYRPQISHFTEIFLKILNYPEIFRTSLKMA